MKQRPRTRLCWICGRKFWGNKFTTIILEDGFTRECHKSCAEEFMKEKAVSVLPRKLPKYDPNEKD